MSGGYVYYIEMAINEINLAVLHLFLILTMSIGCTANPGQNAGGVSNKKQVLKLDPNADIIELGGEVYTIGVDWIGLKSNS